MAKQLNVNLNVKADTQQAQQALNQLGKSLKDIQNIKNMPMVADESYKSAAKAAKELERNLQAAVNVDTGKLDLNRFSLSLKKSNTSITELAIKLNGAGAVGQQAFLNLAKSIALADNSALNLGTKLGGLMTTLKNTARWQISSTILHGFMGAISGAYRYAQDLNQSLNNIRIVTGQTTEQMAEFAEYANKAAKALSTTTTAYTNAALIYYQQGLRGKEVTERTDVTIKMANVSRQSAEEVSNQMTAIWNNFYDGSKSLEHYADVITALGAATASSSQEISTGLEKFAAVAETVGLSYEYATSALATITATTRQSADVVGTALKTLFARIQDLELGETLEDGTTLGKYSKALDVVGVKIKDINGEVKNMDTILDELGAKWNTISKDQQIALAQTVAGTRQYAQLMALMSNWDFMKENLQTAQNSEGTLQEQADIYAESWEAAKKRVQAALQDVYGQLLDDKFFIGLLNFTEKIVNTISNVIEGLGGIKGLLMLIGTIFMNSYAKEMPRVLDTISQNLLIISGRGEQVKSNMLEEISMGLKMSQNASLNLTDNSSNEMRAKYESTQKAVEMTQKLNASLKTLSQTEIAEAQSKIQQTIQEGEYLAVLGREIDALEKTNQEHASQVAMGAMASYGQAPGMNDDAVAGQTYEEAITQERQWQNDLLKDNVHIREEIAAGLRDEESGLEAIKANENEIAESRKRRTALLDSEKAVLNFINGTYKTAISNERILSQESKNIETRTNNWKQLQQDAGKLLQGNAAQQKIGAKYTEELSHQMHNYADYLTQTLKDTNGGVLPEGAQQDIDKFKSSIDAAVQDSSKWGDVFTLLESGGDVFALISHAAKDAGEQLSKAEADGERLGITFGNDNPELQKFAQNAGDAAVKTHAFKDGMDGMGESARRNLEHSAALSEGLTLIGSSAMQVSMAINGIKRIGSIWNNDDLSAGEKLLQTMTSLSMILPVLTTLTNKQKLATMSATAAQTLQTLAEKLSIPVKIASGAAGWAALGPLLLFVAIAAAAIALIFALVKGIQALIKAYNADAIAAEKAAETAKELADAAKEANDRLNDIKSSLESYQSAIDKLAQCTKNTQAWRDALEEVYKQVDELLQKYPELLSKSNLFNSDGTLNIDALNEFQQEAQAAATAASAAALQGAAYASQARVKSDITDASRKYEYYSEAGAENRGYKHSFTTATVQSDLDKVLSSYKTFGSQSLELKDIYDALGSKMDDNAKITDEYAKTLEKLARSSIAASTQMDNAAKLSVERWANSEGIALAEGQSTLMADLYDQAYKGFSEAIKTASNQNKKSYNKDASKLGKEFAGTSFEGLSVSDAFNKARGSTASLARNGIRGTENNRTYVYLENGEEKEYKLAEIQATIAAAAALEQMGANAKDAAAQLATMDDATKTFLGSGSLEGLSKGDFAAYRNTLGLAEGEEVSVEQAEQLLKDQGLSDTVAKQMAQAFANGLNIDWQTLSTQLQDSGIADILGKEVTDGLSEADASGLLNAVKSLSAGALGKQAGDIFVQGLADILNTVDTDKKQEALNQLLNVDWSKWDAGKEAEQIIKDIGGSLEGIDWEKYIAQMRAASFAFPDFESLRDSITGVVQVLEDLNFGDALNDEDYNKLIAYNEAWKELFLTQADGSHKFIGNEQQMKQAMIDDLAEQKASLEARAAAVEKLKNGDWYYGSNTADKVNWGNVRESAQDAQGIINLWNSDSGRGLLESLNYTQERIDDFANATPEEIKAAYTAIADAMNTNYDIESEQWNEMRASFASNYAELLEIAGQITEEAFKKRVAEMASEVANSAKSLSELQTGLGQLGGTFDYAEKANLFYDEYAKGLQNIASQYDSCANAASAYQNALNALNNATDANREKLEAVVKSAEEHLEVMIKAEEAASAYDLSAESLTAQMHEIAKEQNISEKSALALAVANQRMNKGVAALNKNWETWKKTLTTTNKTSQDYADTLVDLSKAVSDLVGWYEDLNLDSDFVKKNMDLIEKASDGNTQSILELGAAVAKLQIESSSLNTTLALGATSDGAESAFSKWAGQAANAQQSFTNLKTSLSETFELIQSKMGELEKTKNLSEVLNGRGGVEAFVKELNAYASATGMTAEQMQSMLSSIGVTAHVETDYQEQEITVPTYREEAIFDGWQDFSYVDWSGQEHTQRVPKIRHATIPDEPIKTKGYVEVASISMDEGHEPPQFTGRLAPSVSSTGGKSSGGGGGSKTKAASHTHEVHRYSNEENTTKGLTETYSRLNDAKDKAFGAERLRLMDRELSTLYKLKDAAEAYLAAVVGEENVDKLMDAVYSGKNIGNLIASGSLGGYLTADYNSLFFGKDASGKNLEYNIKDAAGNELLTSEEYSLAAFNALFGSNLAIGLDAYGNIRDKDDLLYTLDELHNATEDLYSAGEIDENEYNKRNAYIEAIKERMEQYGDTVETAMDKVNENLDRIYEIQEKNAEKIAHELEVANELTENTLKQIQNTIKLLGNTIYRDVAAMGTWFDKNIIERQAAQAGRASFVSSTISDIYSRYQLWKNNPLDTNGLTAEQARDLLGQTESMLQTAFDDIFDQISEMESLFGDTLDYWKDRIEKVTAAMEANAGTLDHLQNVLSLLGKATDYKALGKVLEGQLEVAKQNYEAAKLRANTSSSEYNSALEYYNTLSGEDAEFYKTSVLDKLQEQMQEDTANMQAALENVLEKVNSWFENEVNRIYQESEDRLVGKWGSFDALDAAMQRQHNLADEYLTKTNQLYETNDLLRKLSQDIDKTDSQIAKAKLKAFSDEIEAMKEQNQLSKTDLDIAKARYELLLAQIALEEAQNAKSTVRLQRDNEGNYGYVYTADQDKVAAAEENFAKKQNDLYNLVLGQTQDYTEKIIQTTQERNAALQELDQQWLNGEITDYDEYLTLRQDIVDKYNGLLEAAYASYYTAVKWLNEVGAEGQTEAWTNSFTDILYAQADYAEALTEETANVTVEIDEQMSWLNDQREEYTKEAKVGNDELKKSVDDITTANEELLGTLKGPDGLVNQMHKAAEKADELTRQFAGQYTAVKNLAGEYANLITQIGGYYQEIADHEGSTMNGEPEPDADKVGGGGSTGGEDTGANEQSTSSGSGGSYARVAEVYNLINNGSVPSGSGRKSALLAKGFSATEIEAGQRAINLVYVNGYSLQKAINQALEEYAGQFDTGGYTGEWGKEGRLAFLHEKELVLNKDDTKNFLDAVSIIREINSAINLRAAASSLSAGLNSPTYGNVAQQVEQTVTIHAEFPNAKDHNEIEEAFNNLINRASQYANRQ